MWSVGDGPKAISEGDNGSGTAFIFVIEEGEVRIDAGEGNLLGLRVRLPKAY